ncbi:MAG: hypothetical protein RIQ56_187 [Candidatus Parcubacteria bacterium]|jgi:hypothetical protein
MAGNVKVAVVECGSCRGTGIYRGMSEPRGVGVVCLECKGTGRAIIAYVPFTTRRRRKGIHTVRRSAGTCIGTGAGPTGGSITYKEFLAGKMPK